MYVAIRRYQVEPGARDEVTRQVRDGFVPIISQAPGSRGYEWIQGEDGSMISVSLFDDKAGADDSVRAAKDFVAEHLAQHVPQPPEVTEGEVLLRRAG